MLYLLLTVLVIALIITIAGLVLSSKTQLGNERAVFFSDLGRYRPVEPGRMRAGYRAVESARIRAKGIERVPARGIPTPSFAESPYSPYVRSARLPNAYQGERYRAGEPMRTRGGYSNAERARGGYRAGEPMRAHGFVVDADRGGVASTWIPTLLGHFSGRRRDGSTSWTGITIGLVSIFVLTLYVLMGLLPSHALIGFIPFYGSLAPSSSNQSLSPELRGASQALARLSQLDPNQYDTRDQYSTWAYSACSAAALAEVINAYGHHYRVADVLKVEAGLGEITPALGLTEVVGIERTAARFGFKTTWGYNLSLDQAIAIANQGKPIIIDFPPDKYAGGHILVMTGGNKDYVYLADTSLYNRRALTRGQFMQWWGGFTAILTPQ